LVVDSWMAGNQVEAIPAALLGVVLLLVVASCNSQPAGYNGLEAGRH
jgi:hypothetical protein